MKKEVLFDFIERFSNIRKYFKGNSFTRNRNMNVTQIIAYLLFQRGKTTTLELKEFFKNLFMKFYFKVITKQAFSKQRQNIDPMIFKDMNSEAITDFYSDKKVVKTFCDYILLGSDGSIMELPNTKDLREEYKSPEYKNSHSKTKIARARTSTLYDLENEIVIDSQIISHDKSERALLLDHLNATSKILDFTKSLLIVDRGYYSFLFLKSILDLKINFLFRLKKNAFKEINKMLKPMEEITIEVYGVKLRLVKVTLNTGEAEYLLTNVPKNRINTPKIKELYFKRWGIETAYDIMKNKLHIENFSGKTKISIEQDFYACVFLYNLLTGIKKEVNENVKAKKSKLKYEYQANLNTLAGSLKMLLVSMLLMSKEEQTKAWAHIIETAEKELVPIIPNRTNSRVRRNTRDKYKTNLRPNM